MYLIIKKILFENLFIVAIPKINSYLNPHFYLNFNHNCSTWKKLISHTFPTNITIIMDTSYMLTLVQRAKVFN